MNFERLLLKAKEGNEQHLVDDTGKIEGIGPGMGQGSTHQAADERMGGGPPDSPGY